MTELAPYPKYKDSGVETLGAIPTTFDLVRIGDIARIINGFPFDASLFGSKGAPLLRIRDLDRNESATRFSGADVPSVRVTSDDVLVGMDGEFNVGRWRGVDSALLNQRMLAIRTDAVTARLIELSLPAQLQRINDETYATTVKHLSSAQVRAIRVALPASLSDRRGLVAFLDRELAEIDAFIAEQEELIGLLTERRDASWQSAIDSLSATEVPLRRIVDSVVDGPFGSSLTATHYSESGARVIRLGNIGVNAFKDLDQAFIPMAYFAELGTHSVRGGDVVVAGLGDDRMPLGRAAVVPELGPAIVKADCYRVRPNRLATNSFLAWVLSAPQTRARFGLMSRGSTRQRLNTSVVRDVLVPLPSIPEQERVVAETDEVIRELDATIADAHHAITLSKERRAALISAAVTGKIDVRGHA